jgi:hypothetical protein
MTELTAREKLVKCTAYAVRKKVLHYRSRDKIMEVFHHVYKSDQEVLDWLRDNDPFGSDILYTIYDDAMMLLENQPVIDGNSKSTKVRKNPDLLTDDTPSEFFAQVPGSLVRDTSVSAMAFRIYVALMLRAGSKGHCWPSQELIASEVGLQVRQLREHLKQLEEAEWITIQRRRNKPSIYRLNHAVKKCRSS